MSGDDFAVLREVNSAPWLGTGYQGQGIGTEMRAVLALAFAGLGAHSAVTGARSTSAASLAVSRKLGYEENGIARTRVRGQIGDEQHFVVNASTWQQHRTVSVEIDGLTPCLEQLGV